MKFYVFNVSFIAVFISMKYLKKPLGHSLLKMPSFAFSPIKEVVYVTKWYSTFCLTFHLKVH